MDRMTSTSAARRSTPRDANGLIVLNDHQSDYRDGAEQTLLHLLAEAHDLSSTSDELSASATTWAERYHLDPSRANVLRALSIPPTAHVLEVGAGCGALTRYLGEQAELVDALEPVPARALVARARCRDLPSVEVLVGEVDDLPEEREYDIAIVVGVLEYTGRGSKLDAPYAAFLRSIRDRLRPGGVLVLAIENQLGVKYLAGAPEDHYNVPFEGIEGYPSAGSLARTFSRRELDALLQECGYSPRHLSVFPDYKLTRSVFDSVALTGTTPEDLLVNLPVFPSPDWVGLRARGADEERLWRSIVGGGLAADFANSFLVIASLEDPAMELWPEERLARYFSWNRRSEFTLVSTIEQRRGSVSVSRKRLAPEIDEVVPAELSVLESVDSYVAGAGFSDRFVLADLDGARTLIERWVEFVVAEEEAGTLSFDAVPANLRVAPDGSLVLIDREWRTSDVTAESVVRRGIVLLALRLGTGIARPAWLDRDDSPGAVAERLGAWAGLVAQDWLARTVSEEAKLQSRIRRTIGLIAGDREQQIRDELRSALDSLPQERVSVPDAGSVDAVLARRLELGEAALLRLNQVEKETADHFARIAQDFDERARQLDFHHAQHVDEVKLQAYEEGHAAGNAAGLAAGLDAGHVEAAALRQTLSWRVTGGLRAVRRAIGGHRP